MRSGSSVWVVKIGGSLQDTAQLGQWLDSLVAFGKGRVALVAGGGRFADAVRCSQKKSGFSDYAAHKMALLAMEQYAYLMCDLHSELQPVDSIKGIQRILTDKGIPLWLPYKEVSRTADIPASWETSSDGLAGWLALELRCHSLMLVKSIPLTDVHTSYEKLVELGMIDSYLGGLLKKTKLRLCWMTKNEFQRLPELLDKPHESISRPA